ncbi:hypothetical protein N9Q05_00025 [bacterium]|nr:hypothetical protein [bacterium]
MKQKMQFFHEYPSAPEITTEANFIIVEISKDGLKTRISIFESEQQLPQYPIRREEELNLDGSIKEVREMAANQIIVSGLDEQWGSPEKFCNKIKQNLTSKKIDATIEDCYKDGSLYYLKFSATPALFSEILNEVRQLGTKSTPYFYRQFKASSVKETVKVDSSSATSPLLLGLVESKVSQPRIKTIITIYENPASKQIIREEEVTLEDETVIRNQQMMTGSLDLDFKPTKTEPAQWTFYRAFECLSLFYSHNSLTVTDTTELETLNLIKKLRVIITEKGFHYPLREEELFDENGAVIASRTIVADHLSFYLHYKVDSFCDDLTKRFESLGGKCSFNIEDKSSWKRLNLEEYRTELSIYIMQREIHNIDASSHPEYDSLAHLCDR